MYNEESLKALEDIFSEFASTMTYEKAAMMMYHNEIKDNLDNLFEEGQAINEEDIFTMTEDENLGNLILYYVIASGKKLVLENKVYLSDLNMNSKLYKTRALMHVVFTPEEIDMVLESGDKNDRESVFRSLTNYVFNVALMKTNDPDKFEDILSDANETLLRSMNNFNIVDHYSFMDYLTYNLITTINERKHIYSNNQSLNEQDYMYNTFEENILKKIDDTIMLNRIMNEANLSPRERKIIELKYGIPDGIYLSYNEIGKELKMSETAVMATSNLAFKKLVKASKKKPL